VRRGPFSIQSGEAIGSPHWAQGFSWGKLRKSTLAMARLPFAFFLSKAELDRFAAGYEGAALPSIIL
jgi:hypothetical protein